jgi:hypothetical protein
VQETEIGWAGGDKEPALADDTAVEGAERAAYPARLRDLTPEPGTGAGRRAVRADAGRDLGDHRVVAVGASRRVALRAGRDRRGQRQAPGAAVGAGVRLRKPRVSPDGRYIACLRERHATAAGRSTSPWSCSTPGPTPRTRPRLRPGRDLLAGWDRWPNGLAWAPDSSALYLTADDGGRCPVFRVEVGSGEVTRVTADDGAYTDLNPTRTAGTCTRCAPPWTRRPPRCASI